MTNVFSYQGGSKSHAYVWEMDPPEHIHGHLLGGPFPMQQNSVSTYPFGNELVRTNRVLLYFKFY